MNASTLENLVLLYCFQDVSKHPRALDRLGLVQCPHTDPKDMIYGNNIVDFRLEALEIYVMEKITFDMLNTCISDKPGIRPQPLVQAAEGLAGVHLRSP